VNLLGKHNALNACAVVAVSSCLGLSIDEIEAGLEVFLGTKRRFEIVGTAGDVTVVDDYAHHPTAVRVTLEAARAHYRGEIWAVFQPHTAHRTTSLMNEFKGCFAAADHVVVTPTYRPAGREVEGDDPTVATLVHEMDHADRRLLSIDQAIRAVGDSAKPGDLVLVMGAGDIWTAAPRILERLQVAKGRP
jgi:UDP-N-acetylmuramate--alanine ligase